MLVGAGGVGVFVGKLLAYVAAIFVGADLPMPHAVAFKSDKAVPRAASHKVSAIKTKLVGATVGAV